MNIDQIKADMDKEYVNYKDAVSSWIKGEGLHEGKQCLNAIEGEGMKEEEEEEKKDDHSKNGQNNATPTTMMLMLMLMTTIISAMLILSLTPAFNACQPCQQQAADNETVVWANILINRWWLLSSKSLFEKVKETFDPILEEGKPSYLESLSLSQLSVVPDTPQLSNLRVLDTMGSHHHLSMATQHQLVIESDVNFDSDVFKLIFAANFKSVPILWFDVHIFDVTFSARLHIACTLDREDGVGFPRVSQLSVSLVEMPAFDYKLSVLQMIQLESFHPLINKVLKDALNSTIVAPNKIDLI